jgi:hypothetical protein
MKTLLKKLLTFGAIGLFTASANATILTGEVDSDAYVTISGYDLAWASPCSDGILENSCSAIDMTEQSGYGWNVMTSDLFASLGISASTFIVNYSSANTQSYANNNYAKATGWFSDDYTHIDINDGIGGLWTFADVAEPSSSWETITYRAVDVPAPATLAFFALGLMGLASRRFKNQA